MENFGDFIRAKCLDFAVEIVNMYKHLCEDKKEFVLSKQLLRSGTSIGANLVEAQNGISHRDFVAKIYISLKECAETKYWLELLFKTNYIDESTYKTLNDQCTSLRVMLVASCRTAKQSQNAQ